MRGVVAIREATCASINPCSLLFGDIINRESTNMLFYGLVSIGECSLSLSATSTGQNVQVSKDKNCRQGKCEKSSEGFLS